MSKNHAALNAARWSRARRGVLKRDRYRCTRCGKAGRLEVHHVEALTDGGAPFDPDNLSCLCRVCHIGITRKANRRPDPPHVAAWRVLAAEPV